MFVAVLWASALAPPDEYPAYVPSDAAPVPTDAGPTVAPTASPTADTSTPLVRLAVLGDSGVRNAAQARVAAQMAKADGQGRPFDALLITGDLVYEDGESDLTDASVIKPYAAMFSPQQIIGALGNHDVQSDEGDDIMRRLGRSSPVYVQDVGPVRVVVLNSNRVKSGQTQWLNQVLAAPRPSTPWVIPIMHHPPFSSGMHGSQMNVRKAWSPQFVAGGVKLALAGHDHDYERSNPQNGVTYIVSGGGGAQLRSVGRSPFTAVSAEKHHFLDLTVFADRIEGKAIDDTGAVFDTFTIPLGTPGSGNGQQAF